MITTSEIAPSPVLAPFVRCYSLREFDTIGLDIIKPWQASHELNIDFFFKAKPYQSINPQTGQCLKGGDYGDAIGLGTHYNGKLTFKGCFSFFEINFKPNGFNKIFLLPAREITFQIINTEVILDPSAKRI